MMVMLGAAECDFEQLCVLCACAWVVGIGVGVLDVFVQEQPFHRKHGQPLAILHKIAPCA